MPYADLAGRLDEVRGQIAARARAGGWTHAVRVVAVTKTHGVEAVRAAARVGLPDVGENRVQEALAKQAACAMPELRWHLIGPLQRRKCRQVVGRFAMIHSLDRVELAVALAAQSELGAAHAVLVQVNCSGEPQKSGVMPDALPLLLDRLRAIPAVAVRGLMTMAAFGADETTLHRTFGHLRRLRDQGVSAGHDLPELSMGMSDDFEVAVEEGATMLRLGTRLFGPRTTGP
ncbi:MAG TPA: YggS family pyridoxal phosphate-dependent enzyme [Gemmatimonadales bacterium]|nr:YggS family pyridoxal phosphate-dependent enzyme [Gemmatimonadales bacterium]